MPGRSLFMRDLSILYFVSLIAGASMGFLSPLMAQVLHGQGRGELALGVVSTAYYACVAGAPYVRRWTRRWEAHVAMAVGLLVSALATAVTPLCSSLWTLVAARAVSGVGTGLYMTAAQATLALVADDGNRAKVMGIQGTAFAVGLILGAVSGPPLYGQSAWAAFAGGGALLAMGAVLVTTAAPRIPMRVDVSNAEVRRQAGLPLHAVFAYGFAESSLLSLFPAFLLWKGASFSTTGLACSAFVWGGALSTFPVAAVADRWGRVGALTGCTLFGSVAAVLLARAGGASTILVGSTLVGAGFGPVYALSLAVMSNALAPKDVAAGSSAFTSSFALGCIAGPLATAASMHVFGAGTIFLPTIGIFLTVPIRSLSSRLRSIGPIATISGPEKSR